MAWNDLTIAQRSQLINIFRKNGVTELPEMRRQYDLLHPSSLEEEPSIPINTAPTYDMGGNMPLPTIPIMPTMPMAKKVGSWSDRVRKAVEEETRKREEDPQYAAMRQQQVNEFAEKARKGVLSVGSMLPGSMGIPAAAAGADESVKEGDYVGALGYAMGPALWYGARTPKISKGTPVNTREASLAQEATQATKNVKKAQEFWNFMEQKSKTPDVKVVKEPTFVQTYRMQERARAGIDAPLEKTVVDLWGNETPIPDHIAALMRTDDFKATYPEGVDIWYRGVNRDYNDPTLAFNTRYPALFGSDERMAQHYANQWGSQGKVLTLMTPKGKIVDAGSVMGSPWHQLSISPETNILNHKIYNLNKLADEFVHRDVPQNIKDALFKKIIKTKEDFTKSSTGIQIPGLGITPDEKFFSTDGIADKLFTFKNSTPSKTGVLLRGVDDGPVADEVIWDWRRGGAPKAINTQILPSLDLGNFSFFKNGGGIHIKPENRGKFTALKERTGHSASWFKEHGTPAQKKMAVFDLNSRHWKHADGGPIKKYVTELTPEEETSFMNWYKNYAVVHNLSPNPDAEEHYYDYRGYWKNTPDFKRVIDSMISLKHLPDTWKTPGHDTFSTESMYYKYAPGLAGHWEGDTFIPPEKVDLDEIKLRQRYAESAFNDAAVSPAGAKGAWQIMPATYNEYSKKMSKTGNLLDPKFNEEMRDFIWNDLYNSYTASVNNPLDKVRVAKALAMYNRGRGAVGNWLAEQKKKGVDIYGSLDWIDDMPWKETRDYVNFILLGKDIPDSSKTEKAYRDSIEKHGYNKPKKSSISTKAKGGFIENFMAPHIKK